MDGFIAQDSIKIAVETKLTDTFDPVQLENHLAIFRAEQHKLLILLHSIARSTPRPATRIDSRARDAAKHPGCSHVF